MEKIEKVKIENLDYFGRGIVKNNHDIIFVKNALIGDVVDVEITKKKKNILEGKAVKYYERSEDFRKSICLMSDICGGCQIINLDYDKQLEYKKDKVNELIKRMLKEEISVKDVIRSKKEFNYRNKITLHVDDNKIGLLEEKSSNLVEVDECFLVNDKINDIIKRINKYIEEHDVIINDITVRVTRLNEVMINIYGHLDYEDFRKNFSDILVISINNQVITKSDKIHERLLGKDFYISPHSFFQVNSDTTELLYSKVIDLIKDKHYKKALDLYCGTGTITLLVSSYVDEIMGIEVVKEGIIDANFNKEKNRINNANFILGKVEDNIDKFSDIDLIIVDPPRSGLDKKTREQIEKINPECIVYVSCDPATLMRDLSYFKKSYNIKEISICDMFPNTYHIETVCLMERKQ